jgi:predicted DNA-binding transcriptional regulator YafY
VREIDPYGVAMYQGVQYFAGYDHYREQLRFFRPKKAEWMKVTDEQFSTPENFDTKTYLARNVTSRQSYPQTGQDSSCFIATAAYGTSQEPEIDRLRKFRDQVLMDYRIGELFVAVYYALSPPIAEWISQRERRQALARRLIVLPALWIAKSIRRVTIRNK